MGAACSALPEFVDEETTKSILNTNFDQEQFDATCEVAYDTDDHRLRKLISRDVLINFGKKADLFVSYDAEFDAEGRSNHIKVAKINDALVKFGFTTHFVQDMADREKYRSAANLIESSRLALVISTPRYSRIIAGFIQEAKGQCLNEFQLAMSTLTKKKMVIMNMTEYSPSESHMKLDEQNRIPYHYISVESKPLGNNAPISFTSYKDFHASMTKLLKAISLKIVVPVRPGDKEDSIRPAQSFKEELSMNRINDDVGTAVTRSISELPCTVTPPHAINNLREIANSPRSFSDSDIITVLDDTSRMMQFDVKTQALLGTYGCCDLVVNILRVVAATHASNRPPFHLSVIHAGMKVASLLCRCGELKKYSNTDNIKRMATGTVLNDVLFVLGTHGKLDENIAVESGSLVRNIAAYNSATRLRLVNAGVCEHLIQALIHHKDNADVVKVISGAIWNLAITNSSRDSLRRAGVCRPLIHAAMSHMKIGSAMLPLCGAICNVIHEHHESQETMFHAGVCQILSSLLISHLCRPDILKQVCEIVEIMAARISDPLTLVDDDSGETIAQVLANEGTCPALLHVISWNLNKSKVIVRAASRAVATLCFASLENRAHFNDESTVGPEVLILVLKCDFLDTELATDIYTAIKCIARDCPENQNILVKNNIFPLLNAILTIDYHVDDSTGIVADVNVELIRLVRESAGAIRNIISNNSYTISQFIDAHGCPVVFTALKTYKAYPEIAGNLLGIFTCIASMATIDDSVRQTGALFILQNLGLNIVTDLVVSLSTHLSIICIGGDTVLTLMLLATHDQIQDFAVDKFMNVLIHSLEHPSIDLTTSVTICRLIATLSDRFQWPSLLHSNTRFVEKEFFEILLRSLVTFDCQKELTMTIFDVIRKITFGTDLRRNRITLSRSDIFATLISAIKINFDDLNTIDYELLDSFSMLVNILVHENEVMQKEFGDLKVCELLLGPLSTLIGLQSSMNKSLDRALLIINGIVATIANLCTLESNMVNILELHSNTSMKSLCDSLANAIPLLSSSEDLVLQMMSSIHVFAVGSKVFCNQFGNSGGCRCIAMVLVANLFKPDVVMIASKVISSLVAGYDENVKLLTNDGICGSLLKSAKYHMSRVNVESAALDSIFRLLSNPQSNFSAYNRFLHGGIVELLVSLLTSHGNVESIVSPVCIIVTFLAKTNKPCPGSSADSVLLPKSVLLETTIVQLIEEVKLAFNENLDVDRICTSALEALCQSFARN